MSKELARKLKEIAASSSESAGRQVDPEWKEPAENVAKHASKAADDEVNGRWD